MPGSLRIPFQQTWPLGVSSPSSAAGAWFAGADLADDGRQCAPLEVKETSRMPLSESGWRKVRPQISSFSRRSSAPLTGAGSVAAAADRDRWVRAALRRRTLQQRHRPLEDTPDC